MATPNKAPDVSLRDLLNNSSWILKLTWKYSAPLLVTLIVTELITSLTPLGLALAGRALVNGLTTEKISQAGDLNHLIPWLAVGFVLAVLDAASNAINTYASQRMQSVMEMRIAFNILQHAANLDPARFEDSAFLDGFFRAQNSITRGISHLTQDMLSVIASTIETISIIGALIYIEPILALVFIPVGGFLLVMQWRNASLRYLQEFTRVMKRRWVNYFSNKLTDPSSVAEVHLLNLGPVLQSRFQVSMSEFDEQDQKLQWQNFISNLIFFVLAALATYILMARVAGRILGGLLTIGDMALYVAAAARLRSLLAQTTRLVSTVREGILYVANLKAFFEVQPVIQNQPVPRDLPSHGAIEFRHVSFTYPGTQRLVLHDLNFTVQPGETIAIVGSNGAGKTTLVKLITRLYDPSEGEILVNGIKLSDIDLRQWHDQIGFIFQVFGTYEASAADTIAYGDWERLREDRAEVQRLAEQAKIHDVIMNMPNGYDTFLGRLFGNFTPSRGQLQRIAIARAFARRSANLFILDEPTANVDAQAEYELACHFRELAAGRTTILISHRFSTVSIADRILVLDEGHLVEQGSHEELLANNGLYSRLYHLQKQQSLL